MGYFFLIHSDFLMSVSKVYSFLPRSLSQTVLSLFLNMLSSCFCTQAILDSVTMDSASRDVLGFLRLMHICPYFFPLRLLQ